VNPLRIPLHPSGRDRRRHGLVTPRERFTVLQRDRMVRPLPRRPGGATITGGPQTHAPALDRAGRGPRGRFLSEYRTRLAAAFAPRRDGRVLFPFRRLFIVARW
jgi:hypothetical protein